MKEYFPLLALSLIYISLALTQGPIIENIWRYSFDDGTYSHAYLIPFISIYLYWVLYRNGELQFNKKVNYLSLLITALLGYCLIVFSTAQFTTGYRIGLILFATSITILIFKPTVKTIFPCLFLIFLVPVWGILTPYLQGLSTAAVSFIMRFSGIPVYVEGNLISIPSGVFEIAGGCSGLRYLLVSLAISSLFIFLNVRKLSHGLLFLSVAIIGSLITNWVRIAALISIGHFTNMESELMKDHNDFGWYLYVPFLISLFYFGQHFISSPTSKTIINSSINEISLFPVLLTILLILTFSDYTKKLILSFQSSPSEQCSIMPTDIPIPQLQNNPKSCAQINSKITKISYKYSGEHLEKSINHYLNDYTPKDWRVIKRSKTKEWQMLWVKKQGTYYFITYQFRSGHNETSTLAQLRKYKLINATKAIAATELVWILERCDLTCLQDQSFN